jgi:hypothetical protein
MPNKKKQVGKAGVPRGPRSLAQQSITLHRRAIFTVGKAAADQGSASFLTLNTFPASDIVSLFSEYRVKSVKLTHQLVNAPNNNASFPRLHIAPRGFSNVAPSTRDEVLQYNGVEMYQYGPANITFARTYKPYVWLDAVGTTTGKQVVVSPWIATDTGDVRHNIAVLWLDRYNSTSDPTHTIEVVLDVVIEARGPR